tara:strand:+ start:4825 stop:5715 length:891 start_codon:yes stop_codon:yes gene_type:complete
MRVAIIGGGAVGTAIAADLAGLAEIELQICSRTPFEQLVAEWPGGSSRTAQRAIVDPARARPADWILLCTKAHQTDSAANWFAPLSGTTTNLAILQNGIDHCDRVAAWTDHFQSIEPVVVNLPATRLGPGHTRQRTLGHLTVANQSAGRAFANLFANARTNVVTVEDFPTAAWRKLLWNAPVGGVCAVEQRGSHILRDPELRQFVHQCMLEICAVGRLEGADLRDELPAQLLASFDECNTDSWPSIAVDRRDGRPMEWRARNDVILRLAQTHGISVPANTQLVARLRAADELRSCE